MKVFVSFCSIAGTFCFRSWQHLKKCYVLCSTSTIRILYECITSVPCIGLFKLLSFFGKRLPNVQFLNIIFIQSNKNLHHNCCCYYYYYYYYYYYLEKSYILFPLKHFDTTQPVGFITV